MQGPAIVTGGQLAIGVRRSGSRGIGRDGDERAQLGVAAGDVAEAGLGERTDVNAPTAADGGGDQVSAAGSSVTAIICARRRLRP